MTVETPRESIKISGPEVLSLTEVVLFDLDGILSDTARVAVSELKKMLLENFGDGVDLNFNESQIAKYGHLSEWARDRGFTPEDIELEYWLWDRIEILERAEPIPGATELISWLSEEKKKKVKAHTSRPPGAEEITRKFLRRLGQGVDIPLSIRQDGNQNRHDFKAINAVREAKNFGGVLAVEDLPSHASKILDYADKEKVNVWVLLVPYGLTSVDAEILLHPRLVCIERKSETQSLERVFRYLKGEPL